MRAPLKKKSRNLVYPRPEPLNFFALIKKIFLQTLVEIIFRYHQNPGTPYKQNEEKSKFHIWSVGYQNRVKGVCGGIFEKY